MTKQQPAANTISGVIDEIPAKDFSGYPDRFELFTEGDPSSLDAQAVGAICERLRRYAAVVESLGDVPIARVLLGRLAVTCCFLAGRPVNKALSFGIENYDPNLRPKTAEKVDPSFLRILYDTAVRARTFDSTSSPFATGEGPAWTSDQGSLAFLAPDEPDIKPENSGAMEIERDPRADQAIKDRIIALKDAKKVTNHQAVGLLLLLDTVEVDPGKRDIIDEACRIAIQAIWAKFVIYTHRGPNIDLLRQLVGDVDESIEPKSLEDVLTYYVQLYRKASRQECYNHMRLALCDGLDELFGQRVVY